MGVLVIPIHELDPSGKDFAFALDEAWLRRALRDTDVSGDLSEGPGQVAVHAQLNGREVLVHGTARARFLTQCGRCLKDLPVAVEVEIATLYAPSASVAARHHRDPLADDELDEAEPDREHYSGDTVEIDDLVRDHLLLELPMQPRCDRGWACPNLDVPEDLRSADGVGHKGFGEGDVDPRLAPLMKLVKHEPDKE